MQGHSHASHPGQSHSDWLRYSNQGAIRNDPLHPRLIEAMSFLNDMGITMDVVSGGQESNKPGEGTGSTRHNHGMAADVDFYMNGRKLSWHNPDDMPILTQIVQTAKSRGVTGIGAGDDYMGPGRFHVGFGAPAVWGAGGKRANAPDWLVAAYNGAPLGEMPAVQSQGASDQGAAPTDYAVATGAQQPPNALAPQPEPPRLQLAMMDPGAFMVAAPNALAFQPFETQRVNYLSGRGFPWQT